jgi:hypothetical protein
VVPTYQTLISGLLPYASPAQREGKDAQRDSGNCDE